MTDLRTRNLARLAATGDKHAKSALDAELRRAGYPLWMRELEELENRLLLASGRHNTLALDCLPFMREAYLAAENGQWLDVVLSIADAMRVFVAAKSALNSARSMRPDEAHQRLIDFEWPRRQTELWLTAGKPGRDPRARPFAGDVVGRRLVGGGAICSTWRSYSWHSNIIFYGVLPNNSLRVTSATRSYAPLSKWKKWSAGRDVKTRIMSELFSFTLRGDLLQALLRHRAETNAGVLEPRYDWWEQFDSIGESPENQ